MQFHTEGGLLEDHLRCRVYAGTPQQPEATKLWNKKIVHGSLGICPLMENPDVFGSIPINNVPPFDNRWSNALSDAVYRDAIAHDLTNDFNYLLRGEQIDE